MLDFVDVDQFVPTRSAIEDLQETPHQTLLKRYLWYVIAQHYRIRLDRYCDRDVRGGFDERRCA